MGRKTLVTWAIAQKVQARRKRGATYATLQKEFGLSVGSVRKALDMREQPLTEKRVDRRPSRGAEAAITDPSPFDPPKESDMSEPVEILRRQAAALEHLGKMAKGSGDVGEYLSVARLQATTVAAVAKLTPPPVEDPNELVDIKAAADRCREKLHDMVQRVLDEQAEAS